MKTVELKMMTDAQEKISDLLQPLLECAEQKRNIDEWNDHATKLLEEVESLLSKQRASVVEKVEAITISSRSTQDMKDEVLSILKENFWMIYICSRMRLMK